MSEHWYRTGPEPVADGGGVIGGSRPNSEGGSGAYELDSGYRFVAVDDALTGLTGYDRGALRG
jgi:hypothetical protein